MNVLKVVLLFFVAMAAFVTGAIDKECQKCADIMFVIDESGSVDATEFGKVQNFLVGIVQAFTDFGPPIGVQFASICFSDRTDQRHHFFFNTYDNEADIVNDLENIQNEFGGTYIGKALKFAREEGFKIENGAGRSCAEKFVLVVTDGVSSDTPGPEADILKENNTTIISIGIGSSVNMNQLRGIASDESFVFNANTFDDLENVTSLIVDVICKDQVSTTEQSSDDLKGFCGFPCTLQNKSYELCECDEKNVNQTYSVDGVVDQTVLKFINGTTEDWECYTRSGRFFVLRRCLEPNKWEYICMRDAMFDSVKDMRIWCFSEWVHFEENPSICDVCNLESFDEDKAVVVKEQSVDCGIVVVKEGFCGCSIPTVCLPPVNTTAVQCDACESSEGNDDGLCCVSPI